MLSLEVQRALIGWETVNSQIITAKFNTKKSRSNLTLSSFMLLTNDDDDEKKDAFYQQLQVVLNKAGKIDTGMTIVMGDFNEMIGWS